MRRVSIVLAGLAVAMLVLLGGASPSRADILAPGQTSTVRPRPAPANGTSQVTVPPGGARITGFKLVPTRRVLTSPGASAPIVPALIGVGVVIVAIASLSALARLASARKQEAAGSGPPPSEGT